MKGAAYGAGIAAYLTEQGYKVETVVHLSPDEGDEFTTPSEPTTYQMGYKGDWVTGNKPIEGVDKSGIVNRKDLKWNEKHGSTRGRGVFKELKDLITSFAQPTLNSKGRTDYTQGGSAPNGTQFSEINGVGIQEQ